VRVADFDYELPPELIAQEPLARRDASRLLVLEKKTGALQHRTFAELPQLLRPGDCLVANNSRVIPARLLGRKPSGGAVELLLLRKLSLTRWEALARPARRLKKGATMLFGHGELEGTVVDETATGGRIVEFSWTGASFEAVLDYLGQMPLPPYIHKQLADPERYQTVYSAEPGSAAAPTAGLHFTSELLQQLRQMGVAITYVTLHVGLGTFRPVQVDTVEEHVMHSESYTIEPQAVAAVQEARKRGGRIIAVGTTAARCLEAQALIGGPAADLQPGSSETDIFIYPGFRFQVVEGLITNFHLPKSTLLMLVSAFAGKEQIMTAYREAIARRYRFFSFGDAMLII
jgi:S-adenosylmethionine:tRNA ribosyltransferase-isomerase